MTKIQDNKVYKPAQAWTRQVHKFLHFLHSKNFTQVPKPLGFDNQGNEILSFIPGSTAEKITSDKMIISAAKLLKNYHDNSVDFFKQAGCLKGWMFEAKHPSEVICHNDFAPYNICFVNYEAVGIIDFETASPGPHIWDLAYAVYRFAEIFDHGNLKEQIRKANLFCNSYKLTNQDRANLIDITIERIQTLLDFLVNSSDEKYIANIKDGHHIKYINDIKYIKENKTIIQEALM